MIEEWNFKEYEFDKMCEICYEAYDPIEFLPKILPCCKKTFCLKCIKDNLKKNQKCMNCRVEINFEEDQLVTDENVFHLICPNCYRETEKIKLRVSTSQLSFGKIMCEECKVEPVKCMFELLNVLAIDLKDLNGFEEFQKPEDFRTNLIGKFDQEYKSIMDVLLSKFSKSFKESVYEQLFNTSEIYEQNFKLYEEYIKVKKEKTLTLSEKLNKNIKFNLINEYFQFFHKNKSRLKEAFYTLKTDQNILDNCRINMKVPLDVLTCRILNNIQVFIKDQFIRIKDKNEEFNLINLYSEDEEEDCLMEEIMKLKRKYGNKKFKKMLDKFVNEEYPRPNDIECNEFNFEIIQSKYTKPRITDNSPNPIIMIEGTYQDTKLKQFTKEEENKQTSKDSFMNRYKPKQNQENNFLNIKKDIRFLNSFTDNSEVKNSDKKDNVLYPQSSSTNPFNQEKLIPEKINYLTNKIDLRRINSEINKFPNNNNPEPSNCKVNKSSVNINKYLKK